MKQKIVCLIIFLILAGIYIWTNEKMTFYLLMAMVVAVLFALVSNFWGARGLFMEVNTSNNDKKTITHNEGQANDFIPNGKIDICMHNRTVFPVFRCDITLKVLNLLTDSESVIEKSYMLGPFEKRKDEVLLDTQFCGRVETDIIKVECIDYFFLTRRKCKSLSKGYYYIYPGPVDIDIEEARKLQTNNSKLETYLNRKGNDPTEILDIRDYRRGDSVKMIHWKLSAKWKRKMVRELNMPSEQDTLLVFGLFGERTGENINRLAEYVLSLSHSLLLEDIHHDALLLDKKGHLIRMYSIDGEESYGGFEKRLLNGGISILGEDVNAYIMRHESVKKYASLIYVADDKPEDIEDTESLIYMHI